MAAYRKFFRHISAGVRAGVIVPLFALPLLSAEGPVLLAQADLIELPIEDLMNIEVTTASKFSQKTTEAPASVTVITAKDIKAYGYRTLADILNSVRGVYTTYDRNYQFVGVRGFNRPGDYNSRILLLVDGYRINEPIYDTALIGNEFLLDIDLIDRVEVVRGPGSSVYGSNAVFGVVNVITKRGRDFQGMEAAADAGSFGTVGGRLSYGQQLQNGIELLLSATRNHSSGQDLYYKEFDDPSTNNGVAHDLDGNDAKKVYAKMAYGGLTLAAAYSERIKKVPTAAYETAFNELFETTDTQTMLDLAYSGRISERLELSARIYYGGYTYKGLYSFDIPPVMLNRDNAKAQWWGTEARLLGTYGSHKLVTGAEFQDNYRLDQINFDVDPVTVYLDEQQNSKRWALYAQDEYTLGRGLLLSAGVRYDNYSTVGGTLNPRLALIYNLRPETALKLLYGTAFRAPNAYELYYVDGVTSKADPNLKPEKITSYEFVAEHALQTNFRLTAAFYHNEISNLINQLIDPADDLLVFTNIGKVNSDGAELELERAWADDTRLRASYAWQMTKEESGRELENSPRHLVKFNGTAPLFGSALYTGVELQYMSSRRTLGNASANDHLIANLTLLNRTLARGLEISASVYNLFDTQYSDPGRPEHIQDVISQDGRSVRGKITYRF